MRLASSAVIALRRVSLRSLPLAMLLAAPLALAAPGPAATPPPGSCALLMGGGGTVTTSEDMNRRWFAVNSAVARDLMADLKGDGYRMVDFIVDIRDANQRVAAMMRQLHSAGCGQVVELTNELRADPANPKVVSRFAFVVSVLDPTMDPSSPRTVHIGGTYRKDYEYPLTTEVMQQLSMSALARTMATDVEHAGVLRK